MQVNTVSPTNACVGFGKNDVHVVPWGYGAWAVKREHFDDYSVENISRAEAIEKAVKSAKSSRVSLIIHAVNGKFQTVINFAKLDNDCLTAVSLLQ